MGEVEEKNGDNTANGATGAKENGKEKERSKSGRSSRNTRSRSGEKIKLPLEKEDKEAKDIELKKKEESVTAKRNYRSNREDSTDSDVDFKRGETKKGEGKRMKALNLRERKKLHQERNLRRKEMIVK